MNRVSGSCVTITKDLPFMSSKISEKEMKEGKAERLFKGVMAPKNVKGIQVSTSSRRF